MDIGKLYASFDEDEMMEIAQEAFDEVLPYTDDGDRKYYFAGKFLPKLLGHIALQMSKGQLDYLADMYIDQYWDVQHSPQALRESIADNKYDEDR